MHHTIENVEFTWGHIPVDLHFSYGDVDRFPFTIVRLRADDVVGCGEVLVPPNEVAFETAQVLAGSDARRLDTLLPPTTTDRDRIFQEAFSIALHDLVGRLAGLPLHALVGGRQRDAVPLMPCIFPRQADDAAEDARRFHEQGYKHLKVKLVGRVGEDRRRVNAIREVVPEGLVLQGDANEGYETIDEAVRAVSVLSDEGLDLFEDPLRGDVEAYRQLRNNCNGARAKIMVDALARSTSSLASVLMAGAADAINIHPDQPGSLSRVIHHARMIQAFGVPVHIGGTGYVAVGSAAYQHMTAVVGSEGPCGELGGVYDHHMPTSFVREPLKISNGCVQIPDTPGIGVELDDQKLEPYAEESRQWP
jgi:L-alanine-DL-glutamate epimerase-like enolase superfamily enzyme